MVVSFISNKSFFTEYLIVLSLLLICVFAVQGSDAETRYIATNGNDHNPGTQDRPWKTVEHAGQTINSGDTVIIEDGIYRVGTHLGFGPIGISINQMTTYKAAPNARVIFSGEKDYPPTVGSYDFVRLEGLWFGGKWDPNGTGLVAPGGGGNSAGHGKEIINCTIFGYTDGILIGNSQYLLVYGNRLIHNGLTPYGHGIYLSGGTPKSNHVIVDNNIFIEGQGYGIHGWHSPKSMIITRNFVSGHDHGIVMHGSDHIIANNFVWRNNLERGFGIAFAGDSMVAVNNILLGHEFGGPLKINHIETNAYLETLPYFGLSPIILTPGNEEQDFGISAQELDETIKLLGEIFNQTVDQIYSDQRIEPLFSKLKIKIPEDSPLKNAGSAWYDQSVSCNIGPDVNQPACLDTLWYAFREWGLKDWNQDDIIFDPLLSDSCDKRTPDPRDNDLDGVPNESDTDDDNDGIIDNLDVDRDGDMVNDSIEIILAKDPDCKNSTPLINAELYIDYEAIVLESIESRNPPGKSLRLRNRTAEGLTWSAESYSGWLKIDPNNGSLSIAENESVDIRFETETLLTGQYKTEIVFECADVKTIIPVTLTVKEVSVIEEALLHHWTFDEGSGQIAQDQIADMNVTIHGAQWSDGILGNALKFDGIDDYVDMFGVVEDFSQITIMFWFKTNAMGEGVYGWGFSDNTMWQLFQSGVGDGVQLSLATRNGLLVGDFNLRGSGDSLPLHSSSQVSDGQWHHVALTISAEDKVALYLEGDLVEEKDILDDTEAINPRIIEAHSLGCMVWWQDPLFYSGSIDDVRFYNRPLSAAEIETVYSMKN